MLAADETSGQENPPAANIAPGWGNYKLYQKRSGSGYSHSRRSPNGMSAMMKDHVNRHLPASLMNMKDELNIVGFVVIS